MTQNDPGFRKEVAEQNTILRVEVGSRLHGVNIEEISDRDLIGVCLEPPEYVIGLKRFEQFEWRSKPSGVRSGPGDIDMVIYGARKFCSLALKGNPTILTTLFARRSSYEVLEAHGEALRQGREAFLSKRALGAYLGYMQQQRSRLTGEGGNMRVNRPELIERYGYDVKYASQIVRLGFQGLELATEGTITLPIPIPGSTAVKLIRTGGYSLEAALAMIDHLDDQLVKAKATSELPEEPDYAAVNSWLIRAYQSWVEREGRDTMNPTQEELQELADFVKSRPPGLRAIMDVFPPGASVVAKPGEILICPAPGVTGFILSYDEQELDDGSRFMLRVTDGIWNAQCDPDWIEVV